MTRRKRILIADDDESLVDALARRCENCGLCVERAYDGISAVNKIDEFEPDLVILDVNMPSGSGLSVCKMVSSDMHLLLIPVIILTGRRDDETIRMCNDLLAYYVHKGPDIWFRLEPLVMNLLGIERSPTLSPAQSTCDHVHRADGGHAIARADETCPSAESSPAEPLRAEPESSTKIEPEPLSEADRIQEDYLDSIFKVMGTGKSWSDDELNDDASQIDNAAPWVLCVDDDRDFADSLRRRLQQHGVNVLQAFAGMEGYRTAFTCRAEAIILDQTMPNGNGEYILRRLKENVVTQDIPVIVLTGIQDRMLERKMYNLGAVRFLTKPVEWEDLWAELRRHIRLTSQPTLN